MARVELKVDVKGVYNYTAVTFSGYGCETRYIYKMVSEDGTVYVWKTTKLMMIEKPYTGRDGHHNFEDKNGNPIDYDVINKGDKIIIAATIKGESEYNGEPQTLVNRVKVKEILYKAETPEERAERIEREKAAKAQAQIDSVKGGDILQRMPYRQYKNHYSDCETVSGSFERNARESTILVIIRAGRLKKSGVRGEHYSGYRCVNELGEHVTYRAVSEGNAIKRANKEYKGHEWKVDKIYEYNVSPIW